MKVVHSEALIPAELGAAARAQLIDDLYRVHVEIFDGVDRAAFAAYVVESPADHTSILVHRDSAGAIVGYFAEHEFHRTLHGRPCVVLRGEAGLLRAFRGSQSNLRFGLGVAARLLLAAPSRPVYYLGCLVHPSSYYQLARYMRPVWPSRQAQPDDATRAFMAGLADSFKLKCVADDPLVRQVGWRTRDSEAERGYWQRSPRPEARFFRAANPGYGEGHGLVTLAPVSMASISGVLARIASEKATRNLSTARDTVRRLPVLSRWLGPAEVARHLRAAPLFEGLGDAQIAALTVRAEVVQAPAGRLLFTRGDIGGDLYIIVSGGVHVTARTLDGDEEVLDQLDPGDVFGEIAALTGEARTATIRTATRCTLIRLERAALRTAMAEDPALDEAVWARFVARRFEDATAGMVAFAGTTREGRREHLGRGTTTLLAASARETWRGTGHVFVADGEVEVIQGHTRMRGRAPVLVEVAGELEVVAHTPARVVRMPAMKPSPDEVRQFRCHPLLARLDEDAFAAVLAAAQPVRVLAGQQLFAYGDLADAFYLVRTGAVEIAVDGAVVTTLGPGECFGERGFDPSQGGRRTAGARATAASELLRVPGRVFVEVIAPQLFAEAPAVSERLHDDLAALLGAAWAAAPASTSETRRIAAGEVVVREGEPGDAAWFVIEGLLQVVRAGEIVDRIGPGECFGERSLLLQAPRNATIVAQTPVLAQRVAAAAFLAWSAGQPRLRDLLATLSHVHAGGATTVHAGTYDGHASVTSLTRLADGRIFTATKLLDQPLLLLATDDGGGPATSQVEHMRAPPGTRRRLGVRDDRPLSLLLEGELDAAAGLGERLRGGQRLTRGELERFRWTGELGAPASGPRRLLCGCLGLTRAELDALPADDRGSLAAVCRRTGAGSVCGGCVPLIRRIVADPSAEAPRGLHDEVDLASFEARLDSQRHLDTSRSLVGPETATWRIFGESVVLLGGARALLMQFAHPLVQGLADHSSFLTEPGDRFHRTLQSMYGLAFGDGPTMLRMAREVHEKHARVAGHYQHAVGPYRAGDRYSANQVPLLLWVAATVTDTTVQTYEALIGPLSLADKDRLVAEAAEMYGLFGLPRERHPADWRSFRTYVDGMLASDSLQVGEQARALAKAVLTAPKPSSEPAYAVLRRLTAAWLPPTLRAGYAMEEGPLGRVASATLEATIRTAVPRLPHALRICPARLHAERRIRGEVGPDPGGARIEQILASLLGVA